jgi:hypothetical protein
MLHLFLVHSKAATNAVALANSIANSSNMDVVEALKRWEPRQIELGNNLKNLGISLGNRSQFNLILVDSKFYTTVQDESCYLKQRYVYS